MNSTPTVDDLKTIISSELYQEMLNDYEKVATHKLDKREQTATSIYNILSGCERDFKFLGLTTDQVFEYLEKSRARLLSYAISAINFFNSQPENDGEFPKGEEQGKENKSVTLQVFGVARIFILYKFCEFYLLETRDKDRLMEYLKKTRMPAAPKYARQITKLYNQVS